MAKKFFTSDSLTTLIDEIKAFVESKVSGKANTSHTHSISNVTNLQTTLDGKASSSHNHAASNITSGTLSSDRLPTVPITKGGTGATTAAGALTNLGLTATASELNKMDGVTATTAELNYVDGVTSNIQTQLNNKAGLSTATTSANGLMSSTDKKNLTYFVVGTQTAATGSWTGTLSSVSAPYDGLTIRYYLPYAGSGNASLALNGGTSYPIYRYGASGRITTHYSAGSVITMTFRSSYTVSGTSYTNAWLIDAWYDSDSYHGCTCWTGAGTAAKTANIYGNYYTLANNRYFTVLMAYANTYAGALTLNVSGNGAKPIYINGSASSSSNYTLPRGVYFVYYDGTNYYFRTDGYITGNITGTASKLQTARTISLTGDVTGSATFDGSANATITATVADDSHNHTIANIDNLQSTLDGKAALSHNHAASNITSGTLSSDRLPTVPVSKGGTGATTAAGALTNLGLTATAAELNKMDGITATTAELNYVDGVTSNIQTQLNGKASSSHNHSTHTNTSIAANTDLNTLTTSGWYYCSANATVGTLTNCPTSNAFFMEVGQHAGTYQRVVEYITSSPKVYFRNLYNGTWGSWQREYTTVNKPTLSELGLTATAAELNIMDGVTATASEINKLDGVTATTAELNYVDGVTSNIQTQLDGKAALSHNHAASNITSGTLSSDRLPTVPISKGGTGATTAATALTNLGLTATAAELNKLDGVTATTTELNYVDGVTSNIQTQLNAKQATITGGATTIASSNLTASRALVSDSSGKVAVSAVTSTELGYLDGVTSAIQTQLDSKSASNHTHNYAGSSSAGGAATSANKLSTARNVYLSGGAASTSKTFDGSGDLNIPVTSIKEAYLSWGGKNFSGTYGCIDAAMIPALGANRMEFAKPAGITIEYSRDSGSTWTDYGSSDSSKTALFSSVGQAHVIGKADSTNKATAAYQLRVTLNTSSAGVYTELNKFAFYVSINGSTGSTVTIEKALQSTPTTYVSVATDIPLSGWSGWNIVNVDKITTYGNNESSQYGRLRFTFKCTGGSTTYNGLQVLQIHGYGGVGWATPSNMAKNGHLYTYDASQNATFPAKVTATSFAGNASSASKLNNTTAIGSATTPVYFNANGVPVATTYTLNKSVPSDAKFTDTWRGVKDNLTSTSTTDSLSANQGKVLKDLVDTKANSSHTHTIANVTNLQTTLDGKASTSVATTSANGLMSSGDKTKLNYTNIAYGTCSTAAATAAKVITVSGNTGWTLTAGSRITVKFSNTNTASNPTFNVNSTGAKSVWYNTGVITTSNLSYAGYANRPMDFVYDGTQFVFTGWSIDNNTTYSNASLGQGYGTCSTAEATTAKVVTLSSYALTTGGIVAVKFTYAVPASATMNINSKGAKNIYHRGAAITANKIKAGDIATFVYDGTQYHLLTVDRDDNTTYSLSSFGVTATAAELNKLDGVTATATELNYVDGVTSNIQTQLDAKASSSHSHSAATTSANGFMTSDMVTKLNGIAAGANVYSHPTSSGNKHIPSGGSSGQILRWSADGTAAWGADNNTTYSAATQSAQGLMSANDKKKLDYGGIPIVTTAGTGAAYTATVDGMTALTVGMKVTIIPHTVSTSVTATLNVNSLGAKTIRMPVTYNTSATSNGVTTSWLAANKPVTVEYDGTYWRTVDLQRASAQYLYGAVPIANGGTGATTVADALTNLGILHGTELPDSGTEGQIFLLHE